MILIEPRQMDRFNETILDKTLSKLDGEMYKILHRNIPDDEKAKLYSNVLSRYLNIGQPNFVTKFKDMPESTTDEAKDAAKESSNIESMVMATVSKK